jgi:hypothetical protein
MKKITKWWTELKPEVKQKWEIGLFIGSIIIIFTTLILILSYLIK